MSIANLRSLQARHEQALKSLQAAHSSLQAQLDEKEHAPGAHSKLEAKLVKNENQQADNRNQLLAVQNSLAIHLDTAIEQREVRVIDAERRRDTARTSLRAAKGSKAHREMLSDALTAAEDVLSYERTVLARTRDELVGVE